MTLYTLALSNPQYQLELDVTLGTGNVTTNSTPITLSLGIRKLSGSGAFQSGTSYWSLSINGSFVNSGSIGGYDFTGYTYLSLGTYSGSVAHNTDGTKSIVVAGGWGEATPNIGSGTVTTPTIVLTRIPRGPKVEFNGAWVPGLAKVEFNGAWVQGLMYAEFNGAWVLVA